MSEASVYALLNSAGETIYIGMSINPQRRLSNHRCNGKWGHEIASMEILARLEFHEAEEAEHQAIFAAKPRYNVASVDGRRAHDIARAAYAVWRDGMNARWPLRRTAA